MQLTHIYSTLLLNQRTYILLVSVFLTLYLTVLSVFLCLVQWLCPFLYYIENLIRLFPFIIYVIVNFVLTNIS